MYRAKEVGPGHRLFDIVDRLAKRAGLPQPRCYIIPDASPNAFATGRDPQHAAVAATEGVLRLLTDEELEGVLAHELAHVKHRDILISSVAATLAAAIMMISRFAMFFGGSGNGRDDRGGSNPFALIATIILAPVAAALIQAAISRSREFDADAGGSAIAGGPTGLVSALRKIEVASKQIPLDANPATAHMFIIKPSQRLRPAWPFQHTSAHGGSDPGSAAAGLEIQDTFPDCGRKATVEYLAYRLLRLLMTEDDGARRRPRYFAQQSCRNCATHHR